LRGEDRVRQRADFHPREEVGGMSAFADRPADAASRKGPLCVGLDPRWESLPKAIRQKFSPDDPAGAYAQFSLRVLDLIEPFAGVVKPQAAFFELAGPLGMHVLKDFLFTARL